MAGIDKIYLSKHQIPEFYEFMRKIDPEFRQVFPNSSILWYIYEEPEPEYLATKDDDWEIPVSNFPHVVDRYLFQRPDTPSFIKDYIYGQYGSDEDATEELTEPLYVPDDSPQSGKFKIIKKVRCEGKVFNTPMTYWSFQPEDSWWRWYPEEKRYVHDDHVPLNYLGKDFWWGSTHIRFGSIKAVFRFIRKHRFQVGTVINICDARYRISRLTIKIVPETKKSHE